MKKLGIGLAVVLLLGNVAYTNQLAILMKVFPVINKLRKPVESNRPVVEGPIRIDKTNADPWEEGDALVYWPN
jgi:hypothetical protein